MASISHFEFTQLASEEQIAQTVQALEVHNIRVARLIVEGFAIPITFGERVDWFRNVQAAGACVIGWKGANYPLIDPEVIDWATARSAFSPVERVVMPIIGIEQFVRLRHAPASSDVSQ